MIKEQEDEMIQYQYRLSAALPWEDVDADEMPADERAQCDDMIDEETGISEVILSHIGQYRAIEV
jgi:hypothetical protein